MDASQYKDYVLTLLFMKYVSDKYAGDPDGTILVPEGGSFKDMVALKGDKEIGDKINKIIGALAQMNMFMHSYPTHEIWRDNTLCAPYWKDADSSLKTFDFAVANPPFSYKSWSNGVNLTDDEFGRFNYGTPPDKNGDCAFLLHILKSLNSKGKAAVILPHGMLFRGNAEARIRQNLVR
jgi:type I restriction enzyme M protein